MTMRTERRPHKQGKQPYRAPRLVTYGNLQRLTMVKGGGANDGGVKPSTKASGAGT